MFHEKYRILRELGRGGEGTVYLVQHLLTERFRAAKVLKGEYGKRRFQEINAMKRLEHPSLPQIYDVLEEENQIWLIMEYIKGRSIQEIPVENITLEQFFSIASQLSEVLVYLHSRTNPVLHLDIKPSNLLMKEDGRLVLIDFGAAIRKDTQDYLEECFGTPGFAAPEQFKRGTADERSDIYGVGAVLYYYLFRTIPECGGITEKAIARKTTGKIRRIGKGIVRILIRCLQSDPSRRYQSAFELKKAVRQTANFYEIRKKARGIAAAGSFLCCVILFSVSQLTDDGRDAEEQARQKEEERRIQYQVLMGQAEHMGFEQAVICYEEAARYSEGDGKWILRLLERITEDYCFTLLEEEELKNILFGKTDRDGQSVMEILKVQAEQYGELAYKLGIAYWHYYEGTGGKSAAADWFSQAVNWNEEIEKKGGETKEWAVRARIYEKISSYYMGLGKVDENGRKQEGIGVYWRDLNNLWKLEDRELESLAIQKQLAEEILSCILFHISELEEDGTKLEELKAVLQEVRVLAAKCELPELKESCEAAEEAVQRIWQYKKGEADEEGRKTKE